MLKIIFRIFQVCAAIMLRIKPVEKQILLQGSGRMAAITELLEKRGIKSVEIITTKGTVKRGMLDVLIEGLNEDNIDYALFDGVTPDPDTVCIEEAAELFRRCNCQAVIAVGGGSAIDCAKIAAASAANPEMKITDMKGLLKIRKKLPFLIAVPTTAGTGSEITAAAVVTDEKRNYKFTIMDFCIVPDAAVLDPDLTKRLPPATTVETGLDAFTHAIEAYINLFSSKKINEYAMKALILIDDNIETAASDGSDMKARDNMLVGSYYAGIAFTNGYVGYVHAIAHAIGGLYHIHHGRACAVILPLVLEAYGDAIAKSMASIADNIKLEGIGAASDIEKKNVLIAHIKKRNEKLGIPSALSELKENDIPRIAERAVSEANPAYPVPVILGKQEISAIVRKLLI